MSEEIELPVTSSHEPEWTSNACDFYRNVLSVLADSSHAQDHSHVAACVFVIP